MRASHSSKTYQLGPARAANSACFRDFLTKITGFPGISGGIAPTADVPPGAAGVYSTLYQVLGSSPGRTITSPGGACVAYDGGGVGRMRASSLVRGLGGSVALRCFGAGCGSACAVFVWCVGCFGGLKGRAPQHVCVGGLSTV